MEPRLIVPLLTFSHQGTEYEALVRQLQEGNPPRIITRCLDGSSFPGADIELASFFEPTVRLDASFSQVIGDGPYSAELPAPYAHDVALAARKALPSSLGRLRVVWVPNDPRVPF
ncbi:hypothetical protein CAL26_23790 [Bordetella genomosp. 9]|uniref:Uncharacterized protein n=1 Tax=Bordetella genomosp. 9 TaxID=1416803 RepID=A0A261R7C9_9BORD|nr:hypothetical protein [Bordetella genomosp. 9]OZI20520.1 hypothetical protein CAL26_23790 [Bordetella genomosp. 9]